MLYIIKLSYEYIFNNAVYVLKVGLGLGLGLGIDLVEMCTFKLRIILNCTRIYRYISVRYVCVCDCCIFGLFVLPLAVYKSYCSEINWREMLFTTTDNTVLSQR